MKGSVTKLVILTLFLRVREDSVGFRYFLEAVLGLFVVGVFIRVVFQGQFAVGLFDLIGGRVFSDTEVCIVVFSHSRILWGGIR